MLIFLYVGKVRELRKYLEKRRKEEALGEAYCKLREFYNYKW
jgi:hypothetical protein